MKMRASVAIAVPVLGALVTACSGPSTEAEASAGPGPVELSAEAEPHYLFQDPSTSGPRLDVVDADGNIAVSVGGPIGTEEDVLAGLRPDSSLVELYRALHPTESEVPTDLEALDELVAPLLRNLGASARTEAPPAALVEKSQSAFNSTVCKTFREGSSQYTPAICNWKASTLAITLNTNYNVRAGDRVYGWNNASSEVQISFVPCPTCFRTGFVAVQPFWWKFAWMASGGPYEAYMMQTFGGVNPGGDRGATHHVLSTIIR